MAGFVNVEGADVVVTVVVVVEVVVDATVEVVVCCIGVVE